jgi:hypothetical protein
MHPTLTGLSYSSLCTCLLFKNARKGTRGIPRMPKIRHSYSMRILRSIIDTMNQFTGPTYRDKFYIANYYRICSAHSITYPVSKRLFLVQRLPLPFICEKEWLVSFGQECISQMQFLLLIHIH